MIKIGVTGSLASGKTTAAQMFSRGKYPLFNADKVVRKVYDLTAPRGVMGRNSNNDLIKEKLGWEYSMTLEEGIRKTYGWISWEASKDIINEASSAVVV